MSGIDLVQAAIDRLEAQVSDLKSVEDAAELSELIRRNILPTRTPAAFVLPLGQEAQPSRSGTGRLHQQVQETLGVVLVYRHAGDKTGGKGRAGLVPVREAVRGALMGWQPHGDYTPLEARRTALQGLAAGAVILQMDFATAWIATAAVVPAA